MARKKRPCIPLGSRVKLRAVSDPDGVGAYRWRLEWYPVGGGGKMKTRSLGGRGERFSPADAERLGRGQLDELALDTPDEPAAPEPDEYLIEDLLQEWLGKCGRDVKIGLITETTLINKRNAARRLMGPKRAEGTPRLRYLPLMALTTNDLYAHIEQRQDEAAGAHRHKRHDAPKTIARDWGYLSEAWAWAEVERSPRIGIPMPRLPKRLRDEARQNTYTPTSEQAAAVLDHLTTNLQRGAYQVMWGTGARPTEAALAALDLVRGTIQLQGKGIAGKDRRFPLTPRARRGYELLQRHQITRRGVDYLPGVRRFDGGMLNAAIKKAAPLAGVPVFSCYGLRRLAVNDMRRMGYPAELAAAITGHTVATMMAIYRQPHPDEIREMMEEAPLGRVLPFRIKNRSTG